MRCFICDSDTWHDTGKLHAENPIQICMICGNTVHKIDSNREEDMIKYYRGIAPYTDSKGIIHKQGYRPEPNHFNLITTNNKTNYIRIFLNDFLTANKDKKLVCGDVGSATGYLINFFRTLGHKATGCEYTVTYRRFSEHFYGIPVPEELPKKYKYDLISIYHVLEHMIDPDIKLKQYADMLNEGGHMLIATPEWFDKLHEASEIGITTFECLFHKDHINLFSQQAIKNLFIKCNLKIIKEDHKQYGQTYLLQKCKPDEKPNIQFKSEDWQKKLDYMKRGKQAIALYKQKKYLEAITLMPKFIEAWLKQVFLYERKDPQKQLETLEKMKQAGLGNEVKYFMACGQYYYQQQQYEKALQNYTKAFNLKPFGELARYMGYCFYFMGDFQNAINMFVQGKEMTPLQWKESMDWACKSACQLPTWDERFKQQTMEKLQNDKNFNPNLIDKIMEDSKPNESTTQNQAEPKTTGKEMPSVQPTNDNTQQN